MRIVGGKYKGRVLLEFKGQDIRPTPDKVRESFFNIIQNRIYGASFLDLFSGTGAMGIEALSRGAKSVYFNDRERTSVSILKSNLEKLKVDEEKSITNRDAIEFLKTTTQTFDIIYIDPPYKSDMGKVVLENAINCISEDGIAVLEDEKPFLDQVAGLIKFDQRKYGRVYLTFFKKEQ